MRPTTHDPTATHHGTTHERRALRSAATALKALFWCAMAAEVGWLVLAASAGGLVASALDRSAQDLVHLLVLTALVLSSGLLVLLERRAGRYNEPAREWTLAETLYALVLFGSLFFGVYAFFGWYYSP
jgi:hypothetical protein